MDTVEPCRRIRKWQLSFNLYILYIYNTHTHIYIYIISYIIYPIYPPYKSVWTHQMWRRRHVIPQILGGEFWGREVRPDCGPQWAAVQLEFMLRKKSPSSCSSLSSFKHLSCFAFGISMDYHKLWERTAAGTSCWLSYQLPVLADSWWQGQLGASPKFG